MFVKGLSGTARFEVLKNINLHVKEGEFIAILGYSGVGKSTLMNLIAGWRNLIREIIVMEKKLMALILTEVWFSKIIHFCLG